MKKLKKDVRPQSTACTTKSTPTSNVMKCKNIIGKKKYKS